MNKECVGCAAIERCNVAVQPRSVMCQMYRLQSGQTKAEKERAGEVGKKSPEAMKRIMERLEEEAFDMSLENPDCKAVWLDKAIEIIKEEMG